MAFMPDDFAIARQTSAHLRGEEHAPVGPPRAGADRPTVGAPLTAAGVAGASGPAPGRRRVMTLTALRSRGMTRPRALDLFCGIGGCSRGYHDAGFDVVGVDLVRSVHAHYPYEFHAANALTYPLDGFDVVVASPPCKARTVATAVNRSRFPTLFDPHPDLLPPTLARLSTLDVPWVVENVPGVEVEGHGTPLLLCGSMFGLRVRRHRLFWSNVELTAPGPCRHAEQGQVVGVYGHGGAWTRTAAGGGGVKVSGAEAADALGIDWTTWQPGLSQAIPPAYTRWIGSQLLDHLARVGAHRSP